MSNLDFAPPRDHSRWPTLLIATFILVLIAWTIHSVLPPSTSKVSITSVQIYAPHTLFNPLPRTNSVNVLGQRPQPQDDLYVVLTAGIKNQFRMPISVDGAVATLTVADGSVQDGNTVPRNDIYRLDQVFPDMAPLTPHPLGYDDEIKPRETVQRQIVVQFPGLNAAAWQAKKALALTVYMHNQPPQTIVLH